MAEDVAGQASFFSVRRRLAVSLAVGAAVLAVGVPAALAGRDGPGSLPAAPAPSLDAPSLDGEQPAPGGDMVPPSLPPTREQQPASPPPAIPGAVKGLPNQDGCPVDAPRLLAALRAGDLPARLATTKSLTEVDCYDAYAVARTAPSAAGRATVVFRYTQMTDSWRAIGAGTCDGVPQTVRRELRRCD